MNHRLTPHLHVHELKTKRTPLTNVRELMLLVLGVITRISVTVNFKGSVNSDITFEQSSRIESN